MKTSIQVALSVAALSIAFVAGATWVVRSGVYNVGADDEHSRPVLALLETVRERSIARGSSQVQVPDLSDPAKAVQGAGNYRAMCAGCHLSPGSGATELSRGLYPAPPDLTKGAVEPAEAFWVIKHGIKASGMPAWGKSMEDDFVWNIVAFLQTLPSLDAGQYKKMVEASSGHSHGGNETRPHAHDEARGEHPEVETASAAKPAREASGSHAHAHDGKHPHRGE